MLEVVNYAQSFTNDNRYTISRNRNTGELSCNCPAWIYKKKHIKDRRCKHIIRFLEDIGVL